MEFRHARSFRFSWRHLDELQALVEVDCGGSSTSGGAELRCVADDLSACNRSEAWRTLVLSQASSYRWDNGFLSDRTFIEFPGGTEVHRDCSSGAALNCAATPGTNILVNWPAREGKQGAMKKCNEETSAS